MYKVAIIDDEPIIVEGLKRIIPWGNYGCRIVATANDGMEGIRVLREHEPHMILTDISMPGLDGLNMVAAIKSQFPQLEISVLTGYRDFDYAQRAIKLGVTRFLLKPSNLDEIIEAVEAMIKNLKKNNIEGNKELAADGESETGSFIVQNAIHYIEEHYNQKLTLLEVAEKIYVSQWHLSKLLNRHMGQNFSEILNQTRIRHAKELLKNPAMRIGDIAEKVGFVDMAHFSRVFKKHVGISANEYRNSLVLYETT